MPNTTKERLYQFIKHKKLSCLAFEKACGLSNGYVKNLKHRPSQTKLDSISSAFPELSISWLLTGDGSMLSSDFVPTFSQVHNAAIGGDIHDEGGAPGSSLDAILAEMREQRLMYQAIINQREETLRQLLERLVPPARA